MATRVWNGHGSTAPSPSWISRWIVHGIWFSRWDPSPLLTLFVTLFLFLSFESFDFVCELACLIRKVKVGRQQQVALFNSYSGVLLSGPSGSGSCLLVLVFHNCIFTVWVLTFVTFACGLSEQWTVELFFFLHIYIHIYLNR